MLRNWLVIREDVSLNVASPKIQSGLSLVSVKVDLKLSILKPVHTGWLVSATEALRSDNILVGWEKSGIKYALQKS